MSNIVPARHSTFGALSTDRAAGKQLATIQLGAFLERAEDEARRNLALAKMSDIGMATRHGLEEGEAIASDLLSRVENNPFAMKALSGIAEDGVRGIRRELRRLSEGF
jgi:chloramphenicol 3-O-phosphotransferase